MAVGTKRSTTAGKAKSIRAASITRTYPPIRTRTNTRTCASPAASTRGRASPSRGRRLLWSSAPARSGGGKPRSSPASLIIPVPPPPPEVGGPTSWCAEEPSVDPAARVLLRQRVGGGGGGGRVGRETGRETADRNNRGAEEPGRVGEGSA